MPIFLDFYVALAMFGFGFMLLFFLLWARGALNKLAAKRQKIKERVHKRHSNPHTQFWDATLSRRRDIR